jgi:hypothetical protein
MKVGYIEDNDGDVFLVKGYFGNKAEVYPYTKFEDYLTSDVEHDLVLSDLGIPDYTFEALNKAVEKEECKFIILSGLAGFDRQTVAYLKSKGVTDVLSKHTLTPTKARELANVCKRLG